jgi:hypothetical protein
MLVTPWHKDLSFTFGSIDSGDLYDFRHAERPKLANLSCPFVLVRKAPADELMAFSTQRVHKNRNSPGDAVLHEVRRFERAGATGIERYDYDVGGPDRFGYDKRPSRGS